MANSQTSIQFEKTVDNEGWAVTYCKAIGADGSLLFPKKLSEDYLRRQRKAQGSYIFAHQYQSEIIPADDQDFKNEWLKYYDHLPKRKYTFAFVDPAISLEDNADYTAFVVVDVDVNNHWYLKVAKRARITATQTVKLIFDLQQIFKPMVIGIESVAYQMALMHFIKDEMRKRRINIPVHEIKRGPDKSKTMRIRSLVPRFEWDGISIKPGLHEFEDEYAKFPRGTYVDILDALASIEEIAYPPDKEQENARRPAPNSPEYEKWYIQNLLKNKAQAQD